MLKFCVLGGGISYTLSPLIHRTVFRVLGVDASYTVEDIPAVGLDAEIPRLKEVYDGFNVTKPHKAAIIPYLAAKETPLAAVNTVKRTDGEWTGFNTDLGGFVADLTSLAGDIKDKNVLVLGAGGAAEAVVCGLTAGGARVTIFNRTYARACELAAKFGAATAADARGLRPEVLVNCTSVGNHGECALPGGLDPTTVRFAYDLVYSPPETAFMDACGRAGARTANGLGMLIRQAILADEIFLAQRLDGKALFAAVAAELKKELS